MSEPAKILVVDDQPQNVKLLADLLGAKGYTVLTAASGADGLDQVSKGHPDLVLLDVVMPGMTGYEVCRRIRASPDTAMLPVVMVTSLDPGEERIKGLDAGADDFLTKPVNHAELLARVRSLLRIKALHVQLEEANRTLEQRVQDQVQQLERLGRLKRFFSPQLAELILAGGTEDPLKSHRREVTVVFLDLRGFTSFAETAEPEEVMSVLHEYHTEMGRVILAHGGTLERFAGDGMMVFFNDPVPVPDAPERAVRMVLAMHAAAPGDGREVAQARLRPRVRGRHRARLRDNRRGRLRGALGLWSDRNRDERRGSPVCRSETGSDADRAARVRIGGGPGGSGTGRRAPAQRSAETGCRLQRSAAQTLSGCPGISLYGCSQPGSAAMRSSHGPMLG